MIYDMRWSVKRTSGVGQKEENEEEKEAWGEKSCGTVDPAFLMASGKARSRWHNIAGRSLWAGTFGTETVSNIGDQLGQLYKLITSLTYNKITIQRVQRELQT
jgi:hypothetical protein